MRCWKLASYVMPYGGVDVDHLHATAKPLVAEQGLDDREGVSADELVLPALVVGVELHTLGLVVLAQLLFEVGEQRRLGGLGRAGAGLASAIHDLGDPRFGDDLIPLQGQDPDIALAALPAPEKGRIHVRVHVDDDTAVLVRDPDDIERA